MLIKKYNIIHIYIIENTTKLIEAVDIENDDEY